MSNVDEILKRSAAAQEAVNKAKPYIEKYEEIRQKINPPPRCISTDRTG